MTSPITDARLRECPFCGAELEIRTSRNPYGRHPESSGCLLARMAISIPTDVAAWNRRAPGPELIAAREALKPFADYAEATEPGDWASDEGEIGEQIVGGLRRSIKLGDLRRAARALSGNRSGEPAPVNSGDNPP